MVRLNVLLIGTLALAASSLPPVYAADYALRHGAALHAASAGSLGLRPVRRIPGPQLGIVPSSPVKAHDPASPFDTGGGGPAQGGWEVNGHIGSGSTPWLTPLEREVGATTPLGVHPPGESGAGASKFKVEVQYSF
jgi:hypothetical protein